MDTSFRNPSFGSIDTHYKPITKQDKSAEENSSNVAINIIKNTPRPSPTSPVKHNFTAKEITEATKDKIIRNFLPDIETVILTLPKGFFNKSEKQKKEAAQKKLGEIRQEKEKFVITLAEALANKPLGESVQVELKGGLLEKKKKYDVSLVEKNGRLSMKIQRQRKILLAHGSESVIYEAVTLHSNNEKIYKEVNSGSIKVDIKDTQLHKETVIHQKLYDKILELTEEGKYLDLLKRISPKENQKIHIPFVKPPKVVRYSKMNNEISEKVISGVYLEKGASGALLEYLLNQEKDPVSFKFNDNIQIAKDIIAALMLMEAAGFSHFDLKPENIILFRKDGVLRAKIIDFGFMEEHVTSTPTKINFTKGSALYVDRQGLHDSQLVDNGTVTDPKHINAIMMRRDRVAAMRILTYLLMPRSYIKMENREQAHAVVQNWHVNFPDHKSNMKDLYRKMHNTENFVDLNEAIALFEKFKKEGVTS